MRKACSPRERRRRHKFKTIREHSRVEKRKSYAFLILQTVLPELAAASRLQLWKRAKTTHLASRAEGKSKWT